jgi:hypothetical protein
MANGRIVVDKALLITKLEALQESEVKQYEKDLKDWEKAQADYAKKLASAQKRIITALSKGSIVQFRVSDGYRWENGERVSYGSDVSIEISGISPEVFGEIPSSRGHAPQDPRKEHRGKYFERAKMLEAIGLTKKDEVSLPLRWSEEYL